MARPQKRTTRKDLRQPDRFITLTARLADIFQRNRTAFFSVVAVFVLASVIILGWEFYKDRQDTLASQEFGKALGYYHAGNFREAIAALEKLEQYRWSRYSELAALYQTNAYLAISNPQKAVEFGRRFLRISNRDPLLRQVGLVSLAHAEEQNARCKEAIQHYSEAEILAGAGAFKEQALLGKARCNLQLGDAKAALATYRQYVAEYTGSSMAPAYVLLKIGELEAKLGAPQAGK